MKTNLKEKFINILKDTCSNRFNVEKVINYLETKTDFFIAPASTKFHLAYESGLLEHSLNVYEALNSLCELYSENTDKSTIAIISLFHDLCKANYYKKEQKWVKEASGWVSTEVYTIEDELPLGHGEKSIIMLLNMDIKLSNEEMMAIRWHMSGFDSSFKGGDVSLNSAYNKSNLVALLQCADILASKILES